MREEVTFLENFIEGRITCKTVEQVTFVNK
jgi:hypothetical protein